MELQGELTRGGARLYKGAVHGAQDIGQSVLLLLLPAWGCIEARPIRGNPAAPCKLPRACASFCAGLGRMVADEGLSVLWRGLKPAMAFQVAVNGTRLGVFFPLKQWLLTHRDVHGMDAWLTSLVAGAAAGMVGAALGTPFQLVKTRMQAAAGGAAAAAGGASTRRLPHSLAQALVSTLRSEGAWFDPDLHAPEEIPKDKPGQSSLAGSNSFIVALPRRRSPDTSPGSHALSRCAWPVPRRPPEHGQNSSSLGGAAGCV